MPVRVQLIAEAVADLAGFAEAGTLPLFFKKLIRLEEVGKDAGLPLGRGLTGWRKIVVGDRDWRIIFTMNADDTVATIWVIGDRDDAACYEAAQHRIQTLDTNNPNVTSLAAVMFEISQARRSAKKTRRGR